MKRRDIAGCRHSPVSVSTESETNRASHQTGTPWTEVDLARLPGLEPEICDPKSQVLPITPQPIDISPLPFGKEAYRKDTRSPHRAGERPGSTGTIGM